MDGAWQGGRSTPGQSSIAGRLVATVAEFDSVGLRYGTGAEVLRDLDFRLRTGSFYFLTGPIGRRQDVTAQAALSGSAADPRPDQAVRGGAERGPARGLAALPPPIGVVFQDFRLIRHLSAFDNVALPLRVAGASDEDVEGPGAGDACLGRARRPRQRPPADLVGRRAAARRHRPRGDQPARAARRRRADRQCRCRHGQPADGAVHGA